ncbi:MAG: hypothetical protein GY754_00445 [bacterium]|nr:hypothetical protein [bacterium]
MNKKIKYTISGFLILLFGAVLVIGIPLYQIYQKTKSDDPKVWEDSITSFEKTDKKQMPPKEGILFIGSSSFRFWKSLKDDMNPLPVFNRGFGGAKIPDLMHYARRIIIPYKPQMIVIYCGDNDMSLGILKRPEEVLGKTINLVEFINSHLPETRIYYVSIKPSPSRMEFWPNMKKANSLIMIYADTNDNMTFIDVSSSMFDQDENLKKEIFTWDRIHMNEKGYSLWTQIIKPVLEKDYTALKKPEHEIVDKPLE